MDQDSGNVMFPVFFKLHELELLIVGGGYVGLEKLTAVLKSSPKANVTLVAKEILQEEIRTLAAAHPTVKLIERPFKKKDLKGKDLVILATDSRKLHAKIKKRAKKKNLLTNVADTPDLCDFYLCSIVKKGDLKIGISSNGKSPTLTKRIKETLNDALPEEVDELLDRLKEIRDQLKGDFEYKVKKLDEVTKDFMVQPKKK
ncbi:MAG: precorrin-2 dehydrogenase/sirohydrochlorin ferrochelatase family protein [Flammeovirgaceae bacterium]